MASTTIEMDGVRRGSSGGKVNQGYVEDDNNHDHHHLHPEDANMKNRGSVYSRPSVHEEEIPDLDESGYQPFRQHLVCPYCKRSIITDIQLRNGRRVWITFFMFILTGFCLIVPLFFCYIAFIMEWLKDVYHFCPKCKNRLGKYVRD